MTNSKSHTRFPLVPKSMTFRTKGREDLCRLMTVWKEEYVVFPKDIVGTPALGRIANGQSTLLARASGGSTLGPGAQDNKLLNTGQLDTVVLLVVASVALHMALYK